MRISASNCSETIRQYDAQGWHRTASAVDVESAGWLQGRIESLGFNASLLSFPFGRLICSPTTVSAAGHGIEAVPLLDSLIPPPGSQFEGAAGQIGTPASIAVLRVDQHRDEADIHAARSAGHRAIVVAVEGEDVTLLNAWRYADPWGPPVVQVPIAAWPLLERAGREEMPITIACGATRSPTQALNVMATVPGQNRGRRPLAVLTPRSGWWHCAGERGGGIAVLLDLARILNTASLSRDVLLLATTAHELGYLGIRRALEQDPALAAAPAAWLHLGANIGAAGVRLVVRSSDATLLDLGRRAARRTPGLVCRFDADSPPAGEASVIAEFGGRWLSMIGGGYRRFHSIADRWPDSLDKSAIVDHGELALEWLRIADLELGED